jgi:iron complex transport system substrate-binding protein
MDCMAESGGIRYPGRVNMIESIGSARLWLMWVAVMVLTLALRAGADAGQGEARRIVSLAPSLTETVFALGAGDRLVGVSAYCDYPPEVRTIERVGTFLSPNVEAIVAKRPDVVLAVPSPGNRNPVESLRRLGVRVVVMEPNSVAEVKQSIVTVGEEIGRGEQARALVANIEERMAAVRARTEGVRRPRVLMVIGQMPLHAVGAGTFLDELITMGGGVNVAAQAGGSWPHLSLEFAISSGPEVIIDTTMGNEERVGAGAATAFWNGFSTIPAVRDGRVYGHMEYQLLRPGPRIADALETIARFIHPECFE